MGIHTGGPSCRRHRRPRAPPPRLLRALGFGHALGRFKITRCAILLNLKRPCGASDRVPSPLPQPTLQCGKAKPQSAATWVHTLHTPHTLHTFHTPPAAGEALDASVAHEVLTR